MIVRLAVAGIVEAERRQHDTRIHSGAESRRSAHLDAERVGRHSTQSIGSGEQHPMRSARRIGDRRLRAVGAVGVRHFRCPGVVDVDRTRQRFAGVRIRHLPDERERTPHFGGIAVRAQRSDRWISAIHPPSGSS